MAGRGGTIVPGMLKLLIAFFLLGIVVASLIFGPFGNALGGLTGYELGKLDRQRLRNTVSHLSGVGSAAMKIAFAAKYKTIEEDGGTITMTGDALPFKFSVWPPDRFVYHVPTMNDVEAVCVRKEGRHIYIEKSSGGACTVNDCTAGSCDRWRGENTGNAEYGYYCENGMYTRTDFFQRYYNHCLIVGDSFAQLNELKCPDYAWKGEPYQCMVTGSFRCSSGDVQISLSIDGSPVKSLVYSCSDTVAQARLRHIFRLPAGTHQATATISGGGSTDTATTTVEVGPP